MGQEVVNGVNGMYINNSNVDNFGEIKNTIANSQFGFLPSILKSFYSFKHSQLNYIGASNLDYGVGQKSKIPFLENPSAFLKELNIYFLL